MVDESQDIYEKMLENNSIFEEIIKNTESSSKSPVNALKTNLERNFL